MTKLKLTIFAVAMLFSGAQFLNAQCSGTSWNFDEDDFMPGSIMATETANGAPTMTNPFDLNGDGTNDVQVTYEAVVTTPGANGTCDDGDFMIGAGWGGTGALTTSSDFAATSSDDCLCTNGYIIMTVDFINGWNSDVANFELEATSQNGSSEGYEYGFGYVTAAMDASGAAITGLNTTAAVTAAMAGFCNAQYAAGMTISSIALSSATGAFTNQADDLNAIANDCATSGQSGEDTGSGTGPNSGLTTGASGLAATDIITQVTYIYGFSNAVGTDCDGDGDTGVGSNPSGSFAGVSGCFAAPCSYTLAAGDITVTESCGEYTIEFANLSGAGAADPVTTETYNVLVDGVAIASGVTGATLAATAFTPAGTSATVTIQNATDTACALDLMVAVPAASSPNTPVFVPCTTGTTGTGDVDPTAAPQGNSNGQ